MTHPFGQVNGPNSRVRKGLLCDIVWTSNSHTYPEGTVMLDSLRKRIDENEDGFTLIELVIVMGSR